MTEKREFERYSCKDKVTFDYYEGDPDAIDPSTTVPLVSKGMMLDVSRGGAFIVSRTRVGINMPVILYLPEKRRVRHVDGIIVRTGLLRNNPSEIVKKYASMKVKEDAYIAIRFTLPLDDSAMQSYS